MYRLSLVVLVGLLGCSNSVHPVDGRVHYPDGSPVTHGRVVLETSGSVGVWGLIDEQGRFELGTNSPADGVPPGAYNAYLENTETFPPAGSTEDFTPQPLVHPRFANPKTSGLKLEVPKTRHWDVTVDKP